MNLCDTQKKLAAFSHIHSGAPIPTSPTIQLLWHTHTQSHMLLTWTPSLRWFSTSRRHSLMFSLSSYTDRLAFTLFCRIFSGEGTIGYIGCDSTEQKRSKARAATLIGILPSLEEEEGRGFMFCTLMEA
jgi:hypothetical protein